MNVFLTDGSSHFVLVSDFGLSISGRLLWDLDKASMTLTDDDNTKPSPVAALSLKSFSGKFEQRPTADGLFLKTEVKDVLITGKERDGRLAVIAKPDAGSPAWLQLLYESNPADTDAGVRLHLFVDPVQLKYDADTVNAIVKFFKPPEAVALRQLQVDRIGRMDRWSDEKTGKQTLRQAVK